jgi:uncharacterized protein (TIGR03790 family)
MQYFRLRRLLVGVLLALGCATACRLHAGGTGLNVVVVANQNSSNSLELANYYCERREVPPENVLRIAWAGDNIAWSGDDFQTTLLAPLLDMLASRQLTNQVDYVVLSMDIPFQTLNGTKINSTTSALFYGLKDDGGPNWMDITNSYYASEQIFHQAKPASAPGCAFLATMLTAGSLAQAERLIDQGVASDGTWPEEPVILAKSSDPSRNLRYRLFDSALFNTQLLGNGLVLRTNADSPWGQTNLLGYETGLANFSVSSNSFIPGAMADSLSSFGGVIFGTNAQTSLVAFINAGAAGSYGTVTEPSSSTQKFPNAQNYFYQARGFSLAECYYQSLYAPYEGLVVGEPLAAPFARAASGTWVGVTTNAMLRGTAQLGVAFASADASHPLQQIDLFIDGKYYQTLTNCAPRPGNVFTLALNGYPLTYTVPTNANLATVAGGLAALLNAPATTNLTRIGAQAYGDRIELRLLASNNLATPFYVTDPSTTNPAGHYFSASYVPSPPPLLNSRVLNSNGTYYLDVEMPAGIPYLVQASTNLLNWTSVYTNSSGSKADFLETKPTNSTRRFYRAQALPQTLPQLSVQSSTNVSGILLKVVGAAQPCVILESTNQVQWIPVFTNLAAGQVRTVVAGARGSADALTTFLTASRSTFLDSSANGLRTFNVTGTISVGATLQLSVTKTNGVAFSLSVTNQSSTAALFDLAQQLVTSINSSPALQGGDGLVAEDLNAGNMGTASFNLRARGAGRDAAAIQVQLTGSGGLGSSPSSAKCLNANLSDLQPRNHLYVSAGTSNLAVTFPLDTTGLSDGFHELAAVAYEGTHVCTQSRITLPIQVQNTTLSASLTSPDLAGTASVQGTGHIQVAANTNRVSAINLFSTGGLIGTISTQPTATFAIDCSALGAGLHPFYAQIQTVDGVQYRTAVRWVRLVNP